MSVNWSLVSKITPFSGQVKNCCTYYETMIDLRSSQWQITYQYLVWEWEVAFLIVNIYTEISITLKTIELTDASDQWAFINIEHKFCYCYSLISLVYQHPYARLWHYQADAKYFAFEIIKLLTNRTHKSDWLVFSIWFWRKWFFIYDFIIIIIF